MEKDTNIGGACGEIIAFVPNRIDNKKGGLRPPTLIPEKMIGYAQYVEYKVSHYLDKATESLFGFVSVLPGAFSTFRWEAI